MVKIFTRESCAPCKTLKYWLNKKNVQFQEYSLDTSPEVEAEIKSKFGFIIVPIAVVGGEAVAGLNFARLNTLLGL